MSLNNKLKRKLDNQFEFVNKKEMQIIERERILGDKER